MKKYRLLKDLPTFDKGDIFRYSHNGLYRLPRTKDEEPVLAYLKSTVEKFGFLEKEKGFFEEIHDGPKSIWDLKKGDLYYFISDPKEPIEWDPHDKNHQKVRTLGFISITPEEAESKIQKAKAIEKIHKYCHTQKINREYHTILRDTHFYINDNNRLQYGSGHKNGNPIGYFSEKNAREIFNKFPEELKLILS